MFNLTFFFNLFYSRGTILNFATLATSPGCYTRLHSLLQKKKSYRSTFLSSVQATVLSNTSK